MSSTTPPSNSRSLRQNDGLARRVTSCYIAGRGKGGVTKSKGAWPGNPRGTWGAPDMAGVFDIDLETEEGSDGEEPELGALVRRDGR